MRIIWWIRQIAPKTKRTLLLGAVRYVDNKEVGKHFHNCKYNA